MISGALIFIVVILSLLIVLLLMYFVLRNQACCEASTSKGHYDRVPTTEDDEDKESISEGDDAPGIQLVKSCSEHYSEQVAVSRGSSEHLYVDLEQQAFEQDRLKQRGVVPPTQMHVSRKHVKFEHADNEMLALEQAKCKQSDLKKRDSEQPNLEKPGTSEPRSSSLLPISAYGDVGLPPLSLGKSMDASSVTSTVSLCSQNVLIDDCKLHFSMLYSKSDMFLMVKIKSLECVPVNLKLYRLSLALLPGKSYRAKTKLQLASEDRTVEFNESFRLSNVTREGLFCSAFRMRLYARVRIGKEQCLGETVVHLADVANRVGGFVTSRKFEPMYKRR